MTSFLAIGYHLMPRYLRLLYDSREEMSANDKKWHCQQNKCRYLSEILLVQLDLILIHIQSQDLMGHDRLIVTLFYPPKDSWLLQSHPDIFPARSHVQKIQNREKARTPR